MNADRWEEIKKKITTTFTVLDQYTLDLDPGSAECIEFETPQGKLKAQFEERPRILDKKTLYSNRVGGDIRVDYIYDEEEKVTHLALFRWDMNQNDWVSMSSGGGLW